MNIKEMIQFCFNQGFDGRSTDTCVRSMAVNVLKPKLPVVPIEMAHRGELLRMMKTADNTHIYIGGGVFYFNAFYAITDKFPAPRIYHLKTRDLMEVGNLGSYLQTQSINLMPMNDERLSRLIEDQRYAERYERWHAKWTANSKMFNGLLDGRLKNTVVEHGIWLSSDGGCLICGKKTDQMSTTTIVGQTGVMIGLQLCSNHEAEAKDHSTLLNYIALKTGLPAPFLTGAKVVQHGMTTVDVTCALVRNELGCIVEKVEGQTVTALSRSGFRLILRQNDLYDYAYIVKDPSGKLVSRIDSAAHHAVAYGPDHVHLNLSKAKKNQVESSFTYGFLIMSLPQHARVFSGVGTVAYE